MVTVYTQESCPPCKMVKQYLDKKGVEYTIKDRSEYAEEMIELGGRVTTPLVHTDKGISYGFNLKELTAII